MYNSREIRWFFGEENQAITDWFSKQGINFSNVKSRIDFYLQIPEREDISVKLREGKIEIKQRTGLPSPYELAPNAVGYLENWVKWSFDVNETDKLAHSIIKEKKYNWTEIYKERLGVKITSNPDETWNIHDIKEILPAGCQIEFSKLKVKDIVWYTFAAEWFGETCIELNKNQICAVLGETIFKEDNSFGYNEFINREARNW